MNWRNPWANLWRHHTWCGSSLAKGLLWAGWSPGENNLTSKCWSSTTILFSTLTTQSNSFYETRTLRLVWNRKATRKTTRHCCTLKTPSRWISVPSLTENWASSFSIRWRTKSFGSLALAVSGWILDLFLVFPIVLILFFVKEWKEFSLSEENVHSDFAWSLEGLKRTSGVTRATR